MPRFLRKWCQPARLAASTVVRAGSSGSRLKRLDADSKSRHTERSEEGLITPTRSVLPKVRELRRLFRRISDEAGVSLRHSRIAKGEETEERCQAANCVTTSVFQVSKFESSGERPHVERTTTIRAHRCAITLCLSRDVFRDVSLGCLRSDTGFSVRLGRSFVEGGCTRRSLVHTYT